MKSIFAIIMNIFLAIVAYKVQKQIEKESTLSGGSRNQPGKITALKKKQHNTGRNIKPVITLLVPCSHFKQYLHCHGVLSFVHIRKEVFRFLPGACRIHNCSKRCVSIRTLYSTCIWSVFYESPRTGMAEEIHKTKQLPFLESHKVTLHLETFVQVPNILMPLVGHPHHQTNVQHSPSQCSCSAASKDCMDVTLKLNNINVPNMLL